MNETTGSKGHPALTDEQTGIPNRLHFDTVLDVLFATGARGIPLTVILVGIDNFEPWARSHDGGEIGKVLRSVTAGLCPVVRQTDMLARVDEDLFALCLIDCNMAGGVLVADRIDGTLDSIRTETGLRFSIGGAVFDADMETPDDLRKAAQGSLENARARGGDQIDFHR